MIVVSSAYKDFLKNNLSFLPKFKIVVDNTTFLGDVITAYPTIKHSNTSVIGGFPTKTCSFELYNPDNNIDLENKEIIVYKGLTIDGETEWVQQGVFIPQAEQITTDVTKKRYKITEAKDKRQLLDVVHLSSLSWESTHTGLEIIQDALDGTGIELESNTFNWSDYSFNQPNFPTNTTKTEIISRMAEIGGAIAIINNKGNLVFKNRNVTGDSITGKRFRNLTKEKTIVFNTLVLGKENADDDIIYPETIDTERIEFKIKDNPYVDLNREEMIESVSSYILGVGYTPFSMSDFKDGYIYELNDVISVIDKNGNAFDAVILGYESTSRINSTINADTSNASDTNYEIAGSIQKKLSDVQFNVDHINQKVEIIATETNELNNVISTTTETITSQGATIEVLTEKTQKIDEEGNIQSVKTTNGYTFDSEGMKIYTGADEFNALHTATGTYYKDGETILSQTTKDGTKTKDIELYGIFKYGKETIDDEPMFISQMYEDEEGETGFGHFYNGGEIQ